MVIHRVEPDRHRSPEVLAVAVLILNPQILVGMSTILFEVLNRLAKLPNDPRTVYQFDLPRTIPDRNLLPLFDYFEHRDPFVALARSVGR